MALASAALAFFSRALQASKSRRRFCRRRLSFCGEGEQGRVRAWAAAGLAHRAVRAIQGNRGPDRERTPTVSFGPQEPHLGSPGSAGLPGWEESLSRRPRGGGQQ